MPLSCSSIVEDIDKINIHGCGLSIAGLGVLLVGDSKVGKSQTTLELIDRGHLFIADDLIEVNRIVNKGLYLSNKHKPFIYLDQIGFVNVAKLYPDNIRIKVKLDLVIELHKTNLNLTSSLVGVDTLPSSQYNLLNTTVTKYDLVTTNPGVNSLLIEVLVKQHKLLLSGYDSNAEFISRQEKALLCK